MNQIRAQLADMSPVVKAALLVALILAGLYWGGGVHAAIVGH